MPTARSLLLLAIVLVLVPAGTAAASFDGSNGKVAYVDRANQLFIDDPWDEQPAQGPLATVGSEDVEEMFAAHAHPPAWSPDGTMLAYTAPVPDTYKRHSAVFVMKADGSDAHQVSHPFPAQPDECEPSCDDSHGSWDMQPGWTPDGKVAFIRLVGAGDESTRVSERGTSVLTVDPAGGEETRRYYLEPEANGLIQSLAWPKSSIHPFAVIGDKPDKTFSLRNLGTGVDITSAQGILDLDGAPVGDRLAYTTVVGGHRVHVVDFGGRELESFATGLIKPEMRFTPDGNAILLRGCAKDRDEQQQHCGLVTHRLDDPDGDIRADDPVEAPYLDGVPLFKEPLMPGHRSNFDIQGQDLPVLYLPGFLGSEIQCDGDTTWMPAVPPLFLQPIRLSADGVTNQHCASAGPTGWPGCSRSGRRCGARSSRSSRSRSGWRRRGSPRSTCSSATRTSRTASATGAARTTCWPTTTSASGSTWTGRPRTRRASSSSWSPSARTGRCSRTAGRRTASTSTAGWTTTGGSTCAPSSAWGCSPRARSMSSGTPRRATPTSASRWPTATRRCPRTPPGRASPVGRRSAIRSTCSGAAGSRTWIRPRTRWWSARTRSSSCSAASRASCRSRSARRRAS